MGKMMKLTNFSNVMGFVKENNIHNKIRLKTNNFYWKEGDKLFKKIVKCKIFKAKDDDYNTFAFQD
jgi:hypothetical protein